MSNTATRTILVGVPDSAILNIKVYTPIPTNIEIDVFCNSHVVVPAASIAAYMEVAREHVDDADSGLWRPLEMKKLAGYEINTLVIPCQKFTILRFRDIKTIPRGISDSEILTAATETFPKNMKIQVNQYRSE